MEQQAVLSAQLGNVLIVGAGRMGSAICAGVMNLDGMEPSRVCVVNPSAPKRDALVEQYSVTGAAEIPQQVTADTVILAVKPAKVPEVCAGLAAAQLHDALLISVAAGVSTASIESHFDASVQVVRVMPNTPLTCGVGVAGVSAGANCSQEAATMAVALFESMGSAVLVNECYQDVVTAISGSGPAYFEYIVRSFARAGEQLGLSFEDAKKLALQTMYGTAVMLDSTQQDLDEAITAVSSPGGTTVAALEVMDSLGLEDTLGKAVAAAAQRSKELGE